MVEDGNNGRKVLRMHPDVTLTSVEGFSDDVISYGLKRRISSEDALAEMVLLGRELLIGAQDGTLDIHIINKADKTVERFHLPPEGVPLYDREEPTEVVNLPVKKDNIRQFRRKKPDKK